MLTIVWVPRTNGTDDAPHCGRSWSPGRQPAQLHLPHTTRYNLQVRARVEAQQQKVQLWTQNDAWETSAIELQCCSRALPYEQSSPANGSHSTVRLYGFSIVAHWQMPLLHTPFGYEQLLIHSPATDQRTVRSCRAYVRSEQSTAAHPGSHIQRDTGYSTEHQPFPLQSLGQSPAHGDSSLDWAVAGVLTDGAILRDERRLALTPSEPIAYSKGLSLMRRITLHFAFIFQVALCVIVLVGGMAAVLANLLVADCIVVTVVARTRCWSQLCQIRPSLINRQHLQFEQSTP